MARLLDKYVLTDQWVKLSLRAGSPRQEAGLLREQLQPSKMLSLLFKLLKATPGLLRGREALAG